ACVVVLIVYGRIRHLVVFLGTLVATDWVVTRALFVPMARPSVPALVTTTSYSFPSRSVSALAITLCSAAFVLFPAGGPGRPARIGAGVVLAVVILSGLYLATGYPFAMAYSAVLGFVVSAAAFRWLTPDDGFPVSYHRGGTAAHLDLTG